MKKEIALVMAASAAIANGKDTCNALVLSGGGSNGAWEIGILWGLLHYGNPADFEWDWMSGISAGGINTAAMSGFPVGSETEAVEWLSQVFTTLSSDQIW
jgi:predicted acylesterase/phospholipase RssA